MLLNLNRIRCFSQVGRQCDSKPQNISIAPHCESKGTVLHEIGHALGFRHEHTRPHRFVHISLDNIQDRSQSSFRKKTNHEVDSLGEPYDYNSIMHYSNSDFAKNAYIDTITPVQRCPRPEIGQRVKPSVGDVTQMNKLYNCPCRRHYFTLFNTISFLFSVYHPVFCKCNREVGNNSP
ncbi:unnamed protein product [Schistocephalus solidus]|uniref:Metalloendopeptidase n=1 Tax=Schistocephalus solidus TaxID=70667 RepID=A0A183TKY0_SCHSO|nr:unnamed protein product [Schistocephalus solidus]